MNAHELILKTAAPLTGLLCLALASGCATQGVGTNPKPLRAITRSHDEGVYAKSVVVPAGYDLVFFAGTGRVSLPHPEPGQSWGDTETQATVVLESFRKELAVHHMTYGDIVMLRVSLGRDPKLGHVDREGWTRAYNKFFGSRDQPNKPARASMTVTFDESAGGNELIYIDMVGARPPTQS